MAYKTKTKKYERFVSYIPKTIRTAGGTAYYVRTDVEDEYGRWKGMNLYTRDGFWIIHRGKKHYIYKT